MNRRNYFKKEGDTPIKTFDLKNENFPELTACKTAEKSQLNYKFAIETEDIIEEITDELKPG